MEKEKNVKKKSVVGYSILIYLLSAGIAYFLAPMMGKLYSSLFGVRCSTGFFLTPGDPHCSQEGFFLAYSFFVVLLLTILFENKTKIIFISWLIGFSLFLLLMLGEGIFFAIIIFTGILGFVLGKLILKIKRW